MKGPSDSSGALARVGSKCAEKNIEQNYEKEQNLINDISPSHNISILNISNNKTKINCKTYLANKEISLDDNFKNTYNLGIPNS